MQHSAVRVTDSGAHLRGQRDATATDGDLSPLAAARSAAPSTSLPTIAGREYTWWDALATFGIGPLLLVLDGVAVVAGVLVVEVVLRQVGVDSPSRKTAVFGLLFLLAMWQRGLYRSRLSLSVLDDLPKVAGRWLAAAALAVLSQVLWSHEAWKTYLVNWRFLWGAAAIGVLVPVLRAFGYAAVRRLRSSRRVLHRTVILGAGAVGQQVAEILRAHPEYGLEPAGFLDVDVRTLDGAAPSVIGGPEDLSTVLRGGAVQSVVVAFGGMKESQMVSVIRTCDRFRCELFVVPRLFELQYVDDDMDNAWGLPLVRLRRSTYRSRAWHAKRLLDVCVSGLTLLVMSPILLAVAVAVRLDGGPGILFRQERVGVDGRHFELLKFRSMRPADDRESATTWNIANDVRVSPIGRFLRKTSIDELPQLVNILRGDMSLVGPRPERPHFVSQFRRAYPSYDARHRVPSGLTGWAQIHGLRGDTSIIDRARFDNYYIENWSLWLDVKILVRTLGAVLRATGG